MPNAQIVLLGYPILTSPGCPHTQYNSEVTSAQETFDTEQSTMITRLNKSDSTTRFHFISVQ
jgi:hypothetical protein